MKTHFRFVLATILVFAPLFPGEAQVRGPGDFQITKIRKNLIPTPQFSFGGEQHPPSGADRWLEVEVEFAAAPVFTSELTLKYFILFNGQLLTGGVAHVNIPSGRDARSVVYVTPRTPLPFW